MTFTLRTAMDKELVQDLVRLKLKAHRLPQGRAVSLLETRGDGRPCDACSEAIGPKQTAVLVMVSLEWMSVSFHVDCYVIWELERLALSGVKTATAEAGQSPG